MTRRRWSDHDKNFGPFTYVKNGKNYNPFAIILRSGDLDEYPGCSLRVSVFGHTFIVALPAIIKPWKESAALNNHISSLEKQLKGNEDATAAFSRLKEKLSAFLKRQSEQRRG